MNEEDQTQPTGIAELDGLLRLKDEKNPSGAFLENTTTILIRGGQGAGKTTLALQILSNQLKRAKHATEEATKNQYGLFLSLERSAEDAIKYSNNKFGFGIDAVEGKNPKVAAGQILGIDGRAFTHQSLA
jgi:KaiC/GvpD/RAD55 family RecA-like ATPase